MSTNIIKFPAPKKRRKRLTDVLVDRLTPTENHISLGSVAFTCPECRQISSFDFTNLIFKHMEFYCNACGHGYKVSNPMFADASGKSRTSKYKG